jgi:hypothetical protein
MKQILLMIAVVVLTGAVVTSSGCRGISKGVQEYGRGMKK